MGFWAAAAPAIASFAATALTSQKKSKAKEPDLTGLMSTIRSGSDRQREIAVGANTQFHEQLGNYETSARDAFGGYKTDALSQIDEGRTALSDLKNIQGTTLGRNLQEQAFRPVRGATEFARQNLTTTRSGAAGETLAAPAVQAQQQYGQALNELTVQLQQGEINLADQANRQKLDVVEKELGFQQGLLSSIFQYGSAEDKALAQELISIQSQQTANELQALSFGQYGFLAANAADSAARAERDKAIYGAAGQLGGSLLESFFKSQADKKDSANASSVPPAQ